MVINVSVQYFSSGPFSAASPSEVLSVIALVWELHYQRISCEDKQSRRLQLPPKTHLPLSTPPHPRAAPTPPLLLLLLPRHSSKPQLWSSGLFIYRRAFITVMSYKQRGNNPEERRKCAWRTERKEREKKGGQKAGDVIKIEREWERREKQHQREREREKENTRWARDRQNSHYSDSSSAFSLVVVFCCYFQYFSFYSIWCFIIFILLKFSFSNPSSACGSSRLPLISLTYFCTQVKKCRRKCRWFMCQVSDNWTTVI